MGVHVAALDLGFAVRLERYWAGIAERVLFVGKLPSVSPPGFEEFVKEHKLERRDDVHCFPLSK